MKILEEENEIAIVKEKLNNFFEFEKYLDFQFLNFEEFSKKYGTYGFSFSNFACIRFNKESESSSEICNLLTENEY